MSRPQSTAREAEPEVAVQIDSASVRGGVFGPMLASVLLYGLWADFLLVATSGKTATSTIYRIRTMVSFSPAPSLLQPLKL